jgi:hypothetical protein
MKRLVDLKLMRNALSQEMRRNLDQPVKRSCYLQGKIEGLTGTTIRIEVDRTLGSSIEVKEMRERTLTEMAIKIREVIEIPLRIVMTTVVTSPREMAAV